MTRSAEARELHLSDGRCADLVLGLLEADEREAALAHARECAECETRLRAHAGASERAAAEWDERVASTPMALRPRRSLPLPTLFAAAAALVAVLALPLALRQRAEAPATAWLPAPADEVRLRGAGAPDAHLSAGLAAYAARDLATAERELSAAHAEGSAEAMRRLYLGHVKLARGHADEAAALLGGVAWQSVPEPWHREGALAWARALRENGDFARADSVERSLTPDDTPRP